MKLKKQKNKIQVTKNSAFNLCYSDGVDPEQHSVRIVTTQEFGVLGLLLDTRMLGNGKNNRYDKVIQLDSQLEKSLRPYRLASQLAS